MGVTPRVLPTPAVVRNLPELFLSPDPFSDLSLCLARVGRLYLPLSMLANTTRLFFFPPVRVDVASR